MMCKHQLLQLLYEEWITEGVEAETKPLSRQMLVAQKERSSFLWRLNRGGEGGERSDLGRGCPLSTDR